MERDGVARVDLPSAEGVRGSEPEESFLTTHAHPFGRHTD